MNVTLHINGKPVTLEAVERKAEVIHFQLNGHAYRFSGRRLKDGGFLLEEETAPGLWRRMRGTVSAEAKGARQVRVGALEASISQTQNRVAQGDAKAALSPVSPMPGLVRQVLVKAGDHVTHGQPLVILEAMKLQFTLSAGGDAVVKAVLIREGDLVAEGVELVQLAANQ